MRWRKLKPEEIVEFGDVSANYDLNASLEELKAMATKCPQYEFLLSKSINSVGMTVEEATKAAWFGSVWPRGIRFKYVFRPEDGKPKKPRQPKVPPKHRKITLGEL